MTKIIHNPRCAKSRATLAILKEHEITPEIVEYLKFPISEDEINEIIGLLGIKPIDLIRKGEKLFKESFKGKELADSEWIKIMADNPILIERPIVIKGNKAIIGRPPEKVLELI